MNREKEKREKGTENNEQRTDSRQQHFSFLFSLCLLFIVCCAFLSGCPAANVEIYRPNQPQAAVLSVAKTSTVQKSVSFTLLSVHPVNSVWYVYNNEFGGRPRQDIDVSYLRSQNKLTVTALGNDIVNGVYWIAVHEPGADESLRLGLRIKPLYPMDITFDANGGAFSGGETTSLLTLNAAGNAIVLPSPPPTRTGFVFAGWKDAIGNDFWEGYERIGDMLIYAQWIALGASYTVTFDANGGEFSAGVPTTTQTGTVSDPTYVSAPATTPAYTGWAPSESYVFTEWNTRADGSGLTFTTGNDGTPLTSTELTLYAKWKCTYSGSDGLVLFHNFEGVSPNATSVVPAYSATANTPANAFTATASGNYTLDKFGSRTINGKRYPFYRTGPSALMNNNGAYLDLGTGVGNLLKTNDFTIAVYIRTPAGYNYGGAGHFSMCFGSTNDFGQSTGSGIWVNLQATNVNWNNTTSGWGSNVQSATANVSAYTGRWVHLAYVQSNNTMQVYFDGALAGTGTNVRNPSSNAPNLVFNTLGGAPFRTDNSHGRTLFADFRIYTSAFNATQIANLAGLLPVLNTPDINWDN